jgi:CRISP-associated protein Cas1
MAALLETICSYNNLLLAFDKVEDNGGGPGVDNVTCAEFSIGVDSRLLSLRSEVLSGAYRPFPLRLTGFPKANGKIRRLLIPTVRDRVLHTSAAMTLAPMLDREFEECSFAYRRGRSVKQAVLRIIEFRDKGYTWVVDADVTSFFDEVDHEIMVSALRRYVPDKKVVDLIKQWLQAEVRFHGKKWRLTKGVPQGSPISPLLSNLYLDSFDEALLRGRYRLVRFADDFIILCKDKVEAEDALELTEEALGRLKLSLQVEKTRLSHFDRGFRFLGVEFLRSMVYKPKYAEDTAEDDLDISFPGKGETGRGGISMGKEDKPSETGASQRGQKGGLISQQSSRETDKSTAMTEAFSEALKETGEEDFDFLFEKRPEPEPSASGDPFLRTLYLLEQGAVLGKEDERFVISKDRTVIRHLPAMKVDQILVFGNIQITTQAMKFCLEGDIPVILLSSRGKYFGSIESFKRTNVSLHRRQFIVSDDSTFSLDVAKSIVKAKIINSRILVQRLLRKRKALDADAEIAGMSQALSKLEAAQTHEVLMGIEGSGAASFFSAVRKMISEEWGFSKRIKRPPTDPVNSLLSYGYTLLFYNVYAMVRLHGLHPYVGFLHGIRQGHPALVSDLMEEFRAPVVDAVVLTLLSRKSLSRDDFVMPDGENCPCLLKDEARKVFLRAFEAKMNSAIVHPATGYHVDYRRCIDLQTQAMRRVIEGTGERYEPMTIK